MKYYLCDENGQDCDLKAAFDTLESCQRHKEFRSALCDYRTPGKIICTLTSGPGVISSSYCAPDQPSKPKE